MMVALAIVPTAVSAASAASEDKIRHVVILNSSDPYLPAFVALDDAMRKAIKTGDTVIPELHAETLDVYRFPLAQFENELRAILTKKYHDLRTDVVVAAGTSSLDFALQHRNEIWPDAAIVFHSVPVSSLAARRLDADIIGIPFRLDFAPTLDLALKLLPGTRHVAIVAGTAEPDLRSLSLVRESLRRFPGNLDVRYIVDLSLDDTLAAVRALPVDSLVLYLTMFRDGSGTPLVPRDVLAEVSSVSTAPVFGVFETYIGNGIVAGSITSYRDQGRRAGELVSRILNGEDPSTIGVQEPEAQGCIADWRELQRWGIDADLLPSGCEIRFAESTMWNRYYPQIILALAVILVQSVLILALVAKRRQYQQVRANLTDELSRRVQAESLATRLRGRLARFSKERSLGAMATAISHEINQPLIAIQNYSQAAKRRLQDEMVDRSKLTELFGKIEGQAERAGAITQRIRSLVNRGDLQLRPVALGALIKEVVQLMESEAESQGCSIDYQADTDLPQVLADYLEIQLVLVNLLQNAVKAVRLAGHNDKRISVDAEKRDEQDVMISVRDRGPGVRPDRLAEIFEPLYTGGGSGMGMGLAISQAIIEKHGGRIWYEPDPAGGAIFRFTLRVAGS